MRPATNILDYSTPDDNYRGRVTIRGAGACQRSRQKVELRVSGASCGREAAQGVGISAIRHGLTDHCVSGGITNPILEPAGWRMVSV